MGRVITAMTSGTTGERKETIIEADAVAARCEALESYMKRVGQAVACSFSDDTSIKAITATEAVRHAGGVPQPWPGDEATTLLVSNYSPILKALRDYPDTWKSLKEIWFAHMFDRKLADRIEDTLSVPVRNYYGTTETGCIAIDGEALPGVDIQSRDGVLCVRCGGIAQGMADADGWFQTQDIATITNNRLVNIRRA